MNKQKGFAPILLILLAVTVIGGGLYFYTNSYQKNEELSIENKAETSTTTSEQSSTTSNEVKKNLTEAMDYTGFYVFSESGGKTLNGYAEMMMIYTLDIFKENNTNVAYLNIDGYQQKARMKVDLVQKGNFFSVRLNSYLEGNTYETYKIGDALFNLDITSPNNMKISWGSMTPAFPATDSNNSYFKKDKNLILNIENVKTNIIGTWGEVDKSASNASPITFNVDGMFQGSNAKSEYTGHWEILSNLRNEIVGDDIQRDAPNGAYLKLTYGEVGPLYYEIQKSDTNSLKYVYMSGIASAAIFDLVRMK